MPDQVQLRGGTAADNNAFTGVNREVTVDTTNKTLRVHDGVAAGGHPLTQGTASATADADTIALRDAWGRLQVADPVDDSDVVNKGFMDTAIAGSVSMIVGATVTAEEATTSDTMTDLATFGPSVEVIVPESGKCIVTLSALLRNDSATASHGAEMQCVGSVDGSLPSFGPYVQDTRQYIRSTSTALFTGLTPGAQIFTAKYRRLISGTGQFASRHLTITTVP